MMARKAVSPYLKQTLPGCDLWSGVLDQASVGLGRRSLAEALSYGLTKDTSTQPKKVVEPLLEQKTLF